MSFTVKDDTRAPHTLTLDAPLALNQYVNLFVTYDQGLVRVYLDANLAKEQDFGTINLDVNHGHMYVGGVPNAADPLLSFYNGHIDELRLYSRILTDEDVLRDHSRYIDSNAEGLVAYWKANEGNGPFVFDIANTLGLYHGSDGRIYGAQWSGEIPDASQLGMAGYTDSNGNYRVNEILFADNGENFTVTPSITLSGSIHEFSPVQRSLFIGVGNTSLNNIDFTDVSSFAVSGHVLFEYDGVRSGSEGVAFYLDGSIPFTRSDGTLITTDADGFFEIQVPIGLHYFQARKPFHEFENEGKFPSLSPTYNFQDIVTGVELIDTTRRKLIGRVVGGTREGDKAVGFNNSVNNIGDVSFALVATDNTFRIPVQADPSSNEYAVDIPPKRYNVFKVSPPNALGINVLNNPQAEDFFQGLEVVDLTDKVLLQHETDTLYSNADPPEVLDILEAPYHLKRNYVYRSAPFVSVEDGTPGNEDAPFTGNAEFAYSNTLGMEDTIPLNYGQSGGISFPVFSSDEYYAARIGLQERYDNLSDPANPVTDLVPVTDGTLTVANYLGKGFYVDENGIAMVYVEGAPGVVPDELVIEEADEGSVLYSFIVAGPSTSLNTADLSLSFTKTMQITARAGGNVVYWPGPSEQDVFRGYVFGGSPVGSSFITQGPDMVDFILRDPPGSGSYSYMEAGTSSTRAHSFSLNTTLSFDLQSKIGFSAATFMGSGVGVIVGTISSASSTVDLGFHLSTGVGYGGEWVETYTTQEAFSTSDDLVGATGDIYVGKSQNFQYGNTHVVSLVPTADCVKDEIVCPLDGVMPAITSESGATFQVGSKIGLFLSPGGNATLFAYTQTHIDDVLVPRLLALRNTVLLENPNYAVNVPGDHPLYGSNNDDPVWDDSGQTPSTDSPYTTEEADFSGPSYTFMPAGSEMDSIRWYNQQVRLWQGAIMQNEKEKLDAQRSGDPENVSFSAGSSYSASSTSSSESTDSVNVDLSLGSDIGFSNDVSILGTAIDLEFNIGLQVDTSYSYAYSDSDETTFGYQLADSDEGDFFSVDVHDGENNNGPIFLIADGGETSCPYEAAYTTKYYQPGTQLGANTLQRQKARLEVQVPEVFNIPSDEAANFVMILHNESESGDDFDYTLSVVDETNPDGASLFVDGAFFDDRRTFGIPGGGAIQKIIVMERGPYKYDYEGIEVTMGSTCDGSITSTASLSAHYLPSCTEVRISNPAEQWTVNSSFNDQLQVSLYGYDTNYPGLKSIVLKYRPISVVGWITLDTFYKDTTDPDLPADASQIPRDVPVIRFDWSLDALSDGVYEVVAEAVCEVLATDAEVTTISQVHRGIIDRVNPHAFGNPQPADGVLSPNDEILVQFNETIDEGLLSPENFDIRGILNGGAIRHGASVYFNGVSNHFMRIAQVDIAQRAFSFDFYAKRADNNPGVVLSQGADDSNGLRIGFDGSDQLYFHLSGRTFTASTPITDTNWHHYAVTYDYAEDLAVITVDAVDVDVDNDFSVNYQASGQLLVGKATYAPERPFKGNVHELRIWNRVLSQSDISIVATQRLDKSTAGLLSNWRMEDATGTTARDHIRKKHAQVYGTWSLTPKGRGIALNGTSSYLTAPPIAFGRSKDFTIALHFRSQEPQDAYLLSNGTGEDTDLNAPGDTNPLGWAIGLDGEGNVFVRNNNKTLSSQNANYHDDLWHHVGLSVNRVGNATLYVDGEQVSSLASMEFHAFGGPKLWIGVRGHYESGVEVRDGYFKGGIDELRIWEASRRGSQIKNHKQHKMVGDEIGLVMYYPFEHYTSDLGVYVVTNSLSNEHLNADPVYGADLVNNGATFLQDAASIKLPQPVSSIPFTFSSNDDRIVLSPTLDPWRIENILLDVSLVGVRDVHGNTLSSPITWGAYVDRNQVVWEEEDKEFQVELDQDLRFSVGIRNMGGAVRAYEIHNLPEWLSASPSSGVLSPLSAQEVEFSVLENVNVGTYSEDVYLRTDFGYDERLSLDITVYKSYPDEWTVNPDDYQYSMSVVGQLEIDGVISRNPDNALAVLAGGETRGVAQLEYVEGLDAYFIFLSVYSNAPQGDALDFRVWNSRVGRVHANITPSLVFENSRVHGSLNSPILFQVPDYIQNTQAFQPGWQWLSFNLDDPNMADVDTFMSDYPAQNGDIIKGIEEFDQYDEGTGWVGSITNSGGLKVSHMYKFNLQGEGIVRYQGSHINPEQTAIDLRTGWNWIGYPLHRNLSLEVAFANLDPQSGDQVKGQLEFAIYAGPGVGWVGSLRALKPSAGYMYQSARMTSFAYPDPSGFRTKKEDLDMEKQIQILMPEMNYRDYQSTMSIVAKVSGGLATDDSFVVAQVDGEERGMGLPEDMAGERLFFITVWGNGAREEVNFYLLDGEGNRHPLVANQHVVYKNDELVGDLNEPLILDDQSGSASVSESISIFPNPVKDRLRLIVNDMEERLLRVDFFSIDGHMLGTYVNKSGANTKEFVLPLDSFVGSQRGFLVLNIHTNQAVHPIKIIRE